MDNGQLRAGWQRKTINEIAIVKGGKRVPKGYKFESIPTQHPYITVSDFTDDGAVDTSRLKYISNEVFEQIKSYIISSDDLYISIAGTIGKTGYVSAELNGANLTENACKLILNNGVSKEFVYYFTKSNSFIEQTGINTRVAAQPKLALNRLKTISIPLPPLPEQKRIVAILDEAFAGISLAVANAENNLVNARELFESYLNNVFTQKGDGWEETSLCDEIDLLTGFAFKSKEYTESSDGIKLLRGDNIIPNSFRWSGVKRWSKLNIDKYTQYHLEEHDMVLAMDRTWIKAGVKFAQVSAEDLPCLLVQRVARLRVKNGLDSDFLKFLIGSEEFTRYVLSIQTGIGVPHISGKQIQNFKFCKPSLLEAQKEISLKFNKLQIEIVTSQLPGASLKNYPPFFSCSQIFFK